MNLNKSNVGKYMLVIIASIICIIILWYSNSLVNNFKKEETKKMELLAQATKMLATNNVDESDIIEFLLQIVQENNTIPVVITDSMNNILTARNISANDSILSMDELKKIASEIIDYGTQIDIDLENGYKQRFYYSNSHTLTQLSYFPLIQLGLVSLFILFAYVIFMHARRQEQDKVWIGLARETAHQLGTPITALSGWIELLKSENIDAKMVANEIDNDNNRLKDIAERFSKIGSTPEMKNESIIDIVNKTINYLKTRVPKSVTITVENNINKDIETYCNTTLIEWSIENICRNAIDAMNGNGTIEIKLNYENHKTIIDINDTGKGMSYNTARKIFKAGYTTKKRGWGIGLALTKRIIEKYHKGKIFVKDTELGKGTTMRIILYNHKN